MTRIYFIRNALPRKCRQPEPMRHLDVTTGAHKMYLTEYFRYKHIDYMFSSPYKCCVHTIGTIAYEACIRIITDSRLADRVRGDHGNIEAYHRRRWAARKFHELHGESFFDLLNRTLEYINLILEHCKDKVIIICMHGVALALLLNYYDKNFKYVDFIRLMYLQPYMIRMDFEGDWPIDKEEIFAVYRKTAGFEIEKFRETEIGAVTAFSSFELDV